MTNQQIQAYIDNSLKAQGDAREAYFKASNEYAAALGRGEGTRDKRLELVALKKAWKAA